MKYLGKMIVQNQAEGVSKQKIKELSKNMHTCDYLSLKIPPLLNLSYTFNTRLSTLHLHHTCVVCSEIKYDAILLLHVNTLDVLVLLNLIVSYFKV